MNSSRPCCARRELGPWEPGVQQTVVFVGLSVWNRLNQAGQAAVLRAMQRGAQHNAAKIAEIAMTFNRIDLFLCYKQNDVSGPGSLQSNKQIRKEFQ